MKQVKFTNKVKNTEEIMMVGKVGENVFPLVNNVKETNDAIRWCNTHNIGDIYDCDEYGIEIIRDI